MADEVEPPPLTPEEVAEVQQRIAAHTADPSSSIPMDEFLADLRERYG